MTLVLAVVGALVTVPVGLGTLTEAKAASSVTVPGPRVWLPGKMDYGDAGSITVSQADNLTDQVIQVSWTGFTPSVSRYDGSQASSVEPGSDAVLYPVRVYQCRGDKPKVTDCYGSSLFEADPDKAFENVRPEAGTTTPDFPSNMRVGITGADGSGAVTMEVWSKRLSPHLGCDATHACSIVVEANYGGDPVDMYQMRGGQPDCADHGFDNDGIIMVTASDWGTANYNNPTTGAAAGEMCAWQNAKVIPIRFTATPDECDMQAPDVVAAGQELSNRAMQQWVAGLCLDKKAPLTVQYTPAGGDSAARQSFLSGSRVDVGLTAVPDRETPARPYVYAPLSTTGISIVFWADDPNSGRQFRDMKLNARLVAKLLTQTYQANGVVTPTVDGNPACIFADPEFIQLNPLPAGSGQAWPGCEGGPENSSPIVLGTANDLTYQLTSWIAGDPDAARFMAGERDPWGTRVSLRYMRPDYQGYPIDQLIREDDTGLAQKPGEPPLPDEKAHWKQYEWNPLQTNLGEVLRYLQQGQSTARKRDKQNGQNPRLDARPIGKRMNFAILDSAQAKAYRLPEASLQNASGAFVAPTLNSLQAALGDMPVDPATGTQLLPYGEPNTLYSLDQRAYPLTVVQYAMVPTGGLSAKKADDITKFLRTVTDTGQLFGVEPGRLPEGFLPLTKEQRAQAQDAVKHVADQDGKWPGNQKPPAPEPEGGNPEPGTPTGGSGGTTGGTGGTVVPEVPSGTTGTTGTSGTGGTTGGTGTTGTTGGDSTPVSDGTSGTSGGSGISGGSGSSGLDPDLPGTGAAGTAGATGAGAAGGATTPGAGATGAGAAGGAPAQNGPLAAAPVAAGSPSPDRSGGARLLLPIALIGGAVLLVGGPAALFLGGTPAGARATAATRSVWARIRRRP
ncbi:hypothetical protein ACFVUH_09735 [Kitasatospora sp. NPDC058032]|uniref:hypothetical protein n=1 Tax=Kitasatospora sp. NPDC058032 TaxID=3346307 RepID=UPI0036DBB9CC